MLREIKALMSARPLPPNLLSLEELAPNKAAVADGRLVHGHSRVGHEERHHKAPLRVVGPRVAHLVHVELGLPAEDDLVKLFLLKGIEGRGLGHKTVEGCNRVLLRAVPCIRRLNLLRVFNELLGGRACVGLRRVINALVITPRETVAVVKIELAPIYLDVIPHNEIGVPDVHRVRHVVLRHPKHVQPHEFLGDLGLFDQFRVRVPSLIGAVTLQDLQRVVCKVEVYDVVPLVPKHALTVIPQSIEAQHLVVVLEELSPLVPRPLIWLQPRCVKVRSAHTCGGVRSPHPRRVPT
mmetsp:Transcript_37137/g.91413  ORF Transcript_37137/g.91413 Transcript_37137/m.91413 type:complete len:294 (+) Transcript_37137:575-1456(+)